jgi:hypothetical protein
MTPMLLGVAPITKEGSSFGVFVELFSTLVFCHMKRKEERILDHMNTLSALLLNHQWFTSLASLSPAHL